MDTSLNIVLGAHALLLVGSQWDGNSYAFLETEKYVVNFSKIGWVVFGLKKLVEKE